MKLFRVTSFRLKVIEISDWTENVMGEVLLKEIYEVYIKSFIKSRTSTTKEFKNILLLGDFNMTADRSNCNQP